MPPTIRPATTADLDALVPLFDGYRGFYDQPSDPDGARAFLSDRLTAGESVVLLAFDGADAVGFVQLYPAFTSVGMRRIWILNDLFVSPEARRDGVGRALMDAARAHAQATGVRRLVLETGADNVTAQALYDDLGYQPTGSVHLQLDLPIR